MTIDPTPDWEQLLTKLDRVIEVLEDIRDARRGQTTQRPPTPEEVRRFARGRYKVRITGGGGPGDATTGSVGHDFNADEVIEEFASPQFKEPRRRP